MSNHSRQKKWRFFFSTTTYAIFGMVATCSPQIFAKTENPTYTKQRFLQELLPGLSQIIEVEAALPDDFVIGSKENSPHIAKGFFLGKKETLEKYFAGEIPLDSCIIAVKLSNTVVQDGPMSFHADAKIKKEWKQLGGHKYAMKKLNWGNYPLFSLESVSLSGTHYFLLWVGLNDPEGQTVLFTFLCPDFKNCPNDTELSIWYHFLLNSVDLSQKRDS